LGAEGDASLRLDRRDKNLRNLDCIFLFALVAVSALPYLRGLGFYSDDWETMAVLARSAHEGLSAMTRQLLAVDPDMLIRPVQLAVLVGEFNLFGPFHATAYHIVITGILGLTLVIVYLAAYELGLGRWVAFTIALVFGTLPHYSTDKFWISSQQATLCVGFACLGIYALQKAINASQRIRVLWTLFAAVAMILSFLSYEVALGLIAAALAHAAWRVWRSAEGSTGRRLKGLVFIVVVMSTLVAVGLAKARLQTRMVSHHGLLSWLGRIRGLIWHQIVQAALFNVWTYWLHIPSTLAAMYRQNAFDISAVAVSVLIALATALYLWKYPPSAMPGLRACWSLIAAGFVVFWLGSFLFVSNFYADFSTAGLTNRITIASALGAACVEVGVIGLACSMLKPKIGTRVLVVALGLICGVNCLTTSGIAWFWKDAAVRQAAVLKSVSDHVENLPQASVLLLDGFCRFSGPGTVFETDWDASGATRIRLQDFSLVSDVVSRNLHVENDAINTTYYGEPEGHYRYSPNLYVYNVQKTSLVRLPSKQAAVDYFKLMNPSGDSGCPFGYEGLGTKVF
jgi:hypothetical protein